MRTARSLLTLGLLVGCGQSAESFIAQNKGSTLVACIRSIKGYERSPFFMCRDAGHAVWVCTSGDSGSKCVPLSVISQQWQGPTAEASDGTH